MSADRSHGGSSGRGTWRSWFVPRLLALFGMLLGVGAAPAFAQDGAPESEDSGRTVYESSCVGCHQAGGRGVEGVFPSLRDNELVQGPPEALLIVVLEGRAAMPGFSETLSNQQIAAVLSYLRNNWGNDAKRIPRDEIVEMRKHLETTKPQGKNGG